MKKLSSQVNRLLPRFVTEENPTFAKFVEYYLEFIESYHEQKNAALPENERLDISDPYALLSNLIINHDIDLTSKLFLEHYKRTYLAKFFYDGDISSFNPTGTSTNFRFLIKKIRDFYLSKGSINSIQFFFRSIYGVSVDVYIPKFDILRASDGNWFEPTVIRPTEAILIDNLGNETIIPIEQRLSQVLGLSEWDNSKTYTVNDRVWYNGNIWISQNTSNTDEPTIGSTKWNIYNPTRTDWLELFPLRNEIRTADASGFIRDIRKPNIQAWESAKTYLLDSLVRYDNKDWIAIAESTGEEPGTGASWEEYDTPFYLELNNTTGTIRQGARVEMRDPLLVDSATNGASDDLVLGTFKLGLPVVAEEWEKFSNEDQTLLQGYTTGARVSVNLDNYTLPVGVQTPFYLSPEDPQTTIEVIALNGIITDDVSTLLAVPTDGSPYSDQLDIDDASYGSVSELEDGLLIRVPNGITYNIVDVDPGAGTDAVIEFSGTYDSTFWVAEPEKSFNNIIREPGLWLNEDSWLSDKKVLQDNDLYQDFSYRVETPVDQSIYEKNFLDNIHPTGLKFFSLRTAGAPAEIGNFSVSIGIEQNLWVVEWSQLEDLGVDVSAETSVSERTRWNVLTSVQRSTIDYAHAERIMTSSPNYNVWEAEVSQENVRFVNDFLLYGGYNHTLSFRSEGSAFRKVLTADERFSISNNTVFYTEIDNVGHAATRQTEFSEMVVFHLFPRKRTSYHEELVNGESLTIGVNNVSIVLSVPSDMIHEFASLNLSNILVFINGRLAPATDYSITSVVGGIEFNMLKPKSDFVSFYSSEYKDIELVFMDDNNIPTRETITVPANTELEVVTYNSRNRENFLVFQNGLLAENSITRKQYKNLRIANETGNPLDYEIVSFNEMTNQVINRVERIKPIFQDSLYETDSLSNTTYITEIVGQNRLNQHTTAPPYNRRAPNQFETIPSGPVPPQET